MKNTNKSLQRLARLIVRHWIGLVVVTLTALVLAIGSPAWAANGPIEFYQTVPAPRPTRAPSLPKPTATAEDDGEEEEDNSNQPSVPQPPAPPSPTPQPLAPQAPTRVSLVGIVNVSALNVRLGPGVSFPVIGKLVLGDSVSVLNRDQVGSWWLICCTKTDLRPGWVSAPLLQPNFDPSRANELLTVASESAIAPSPQALQPATPQPVVIATPTTARPAAVAGTVPISATPRAAVNAVQLNLRSGPGVDFTILGKLPRGAAVTILSRNGKGDWWYVCCVDGTNTAGWVSAPYLSPSFSRRSANQVLPVFVATRTPITPTNAPALTQQVTQTGATIRAIAAAPVSAPVSVSTATLDAQMKLKPAFGRPGRPLQIVVSITNTGTVPATNVVLRNELAQSLTLMSGSASDGGSFQSKTTNSAATVATFTWPQVGAGKQVSAIITVRVASDLPAGSVVDNLAAVQADNAGVATTGVAIGLPPAALPMFR